MALMKTMSNRSKAGLFTVSSLTILLLQLLASAKSASVVSEALVDMSGYFFPQEGCPNPAKNKCPNSNISYYLYTHETQDSPYELDPSNPDSIMDANFIPGVPLKIIIHGYTGNKDYDPNTQLRPAYFQHGEYNIISIDWGQLAPAPCYYEAAQNVELVAQCATKLLNSIFQLRRREVRPSNTHILGFSLGAHVAGLLASNFKTAKVSRVTGFDPALPLYDQTQRPQHKMINKDVADFVDVYHSNSGLQGKKAACGNVDVYFNNAVSQPGCGCNGTCDHLRAVEYFAESINSDVGLWGFSCGSWDSYLEGSCNLNTTGDLIQLGNSLTIGNGVFLAFTNNTAPFLFSPSVYLEDSSLAEKVLEVCTLEHYLALL